MATASIRDSSLEYLLECVVCTERLENPRVLGCGHHFCQNCLTVLAARKHGRCVSCPTCRRDTKLSAGGVAALPRHYLAGELLERTSSIRSQTPEEGSGRKCDVCKNGSNVASTRCQDCAKNMCRECFDNHAKLEAYRCHRSVGLSDFLFCETHPEVAVALYCTDCKTRVCLDCAIKAHKDHGTREIQELAAETRETLKKILASPEVQHDDTVMVHSILAAGQKNDDDHAIFKSDIQRLRHTLKVALKKLNETEAKVNHMHSAEKQNIKETLSELSGLSRMRKDVKQLAGSLLEGRPDVEVVVRAQDIPPPSSLPVRIVYNITEPRVVGSLKQMDASVKEMSSSCDVIAKTTSVHPEKPTGKLTKVLEVSVNKNIIGVCQTIEDGERRIVLRTNDVGFPIKLYGVDGVLHRQFGGGVVGLCDGTARDIAVDTRRALYVTPCQDKIVRLEQTGSWRDDIRLAGSLRGVVCIETTDIYVVSVWDKHTIVVINAETKQVIREFGSFGDGVEHFNHPAYLCMTFPEPSLTFAVSDHDNHRVCLYTGAGTLVSTYGGPGSDSGQLSHPWDVCVDPAGRLVVCDIDNCRVSSYWREAGEVRTEVLLGEEQLRSRPKLVDIDVNRRLLCVATFDKLLQIYSF